MERSVAMTIDWTRPDFRVDGFVEEGPSMKALKLTDFEGEWHLERRIEDSRVGQSGQLIGLATFAPVNDEPGLLKYSEKGTLRMQDQPPLDATRSYFWQQTEAGIDVMFEDRRPFHQIAADRSMPDDTHHCAPDLYHVSYSFVKWPDWQAMWRVVGPKKDYRMLSRYRRA